MLNRLLKSKLLGNTAIYALANVLNGAIPFMLLPILTRVFTPEEYGLVTLVSAVIAIMGAFTGLSAHGAVSVKYFDKEVNHPQFVGTSLLVLAGSTVFILLLLLFTGDSISTLINLPRKWLFIAALTSAAQFVINIRLTMWQLQDQPMKYGFFQITQTIFNLSLSLALVFWAIWGWEGRTWGIVIAMLVFSGLAIISMYLSSLVTFNHDRAYIKAMLKFGIPLIPHTLGGFAMAMSDRFILSAKLSIESVGIYSVGMQMAMVIGVFADAFSKAYGPYLYKLLSNEPLMLRKLVHNSYYIFIGFLSIALIYNIAIEFFYTIFIGDAFIGSLVVAKIGAFGYAFTGMYYALANILFYKEKTGYISMLTFTSGTLSLILTYVLVVHMGIIGASISFLISQFLFFIGTVALVQRFFPLPWFTSVTNTKS